MPALQMVVKMTIHVCGAPETAAGKRTQLCNEGKKLCQTLGPGVSAHVCVGAPTFDLLLPHRRSGSSSWGREITGTELCAPSFLVFSEALCY